MQTVYITHAKRTPIGSLMGVLSTISAHLLSSKLIQTILQDSQFDPGLIDEVILGHVISAGCGQNSARQSLVHAGIPNTVPALTINKVCGSSLKAICMAAESIMLNHNKVVIAGGHENMSLSLHGTYIRRGAKFGDAKLTDLMLNDGLIDAFSQKAMGVTAEAVAKKFKITREMQDKFAFDSHMKAAHATANNIFAAEIVPIEVKNKNIITTVDKDESIKADTKIAILSGLKAVFSNAEEATVTAGNSSTINDGAACVMLVSEDVLHKYNLTPIARIVSFASTGIDPEIMGIGPISASKAALSRAAWKVEDLDLIECNEAFAASSIYVNQQMDWDISKLNVNGGAIALGHPIGASGARIFVTLIHQMQKQRAKRGLASLCIGGGMGIAMCIEGI